MTRELRVVGPDETASALRAALSGDGPAILPRSPDAPPASGPRSIDLSARELPTTVPRRIALVIETSGSTGRPKRVALSADALLASAAASDSFLGAPGQWLLALPTHYIAGVNVLVRSLASGTEPVAVGRGPFTPEAFLHAVARFDDPVRYASLVPAQLARLLDDEDAAAALAGFARVLVGGQPLDPHLRRRAADSGVRITTTYGSSETGGGCVYDGRPIGTARVLIADGEVRLAGPMLADGYLDDPARTDAAFVVDDGERWYRTGDAGESADGVLRVTARLDDVIISGGEKVSLGAIERVVRGIRGLENAVVVRAASERWGEVPVVVATTGIDLGALRETVAAALGRGAAPDRVVVVDELPLLESGKPDRVQLGLLATR